MRSSLWNHADWHTCQGQPIENPWWRIKHTEDLETATRDQQTLHQPSEVMATRMSRYKRDNQQGRNSNKRPCPGCGSLSMNKKAPLIALRTAQHGEPFVTIAKYQITLPKSAERLKNQRIMLTQSVLSKPLMTKSMSQCYLHCHACKNLFLQFGIPS